MSYDANGNMTGVTDALGQTTSFQYDSMDRVLKATDARGASVQYTYDLNGRVMQVLDPLNAATQYEYDSMGNVTLVKDAESRATQYAYDALDRLTSVTDGTGVTTSYGYDSVGNLVTRTDGEGKTTAYAYDLAGQLVSTTNAKGETTQNTYNEVGNRVGAQLPSGKSITYDYDALDALVQKSYSTGEADVFYSYSPDGNLVSMRDATGDSTYTYDANGRLVSYTNAFSATVSYAYNENGGISAITYPDGKTVGYEYDALGRMVKVTGRDGGETVYEYDAQGSVTKVVRADGSVTTAEYDLGGRVVRLTNCDASGAVVSEFSYTYDATGYIATETVTQGERSAERSYTYTQRGELATATENGQTVAYTYDGAGNRIKEEGPNGTTVFVYDEADRLQSTGGASVTAYTWDADGNMTSMESGEGVYEYIYDTESRLLAVREGGSLLMSVLYDGLGDRSYGLEFKMIDRHLNKFPHLPGYWNNGHWNCIPDAPEGPKNPKQANAAAENTPAEAEEGPGFWQGVVDWFTGLFGGGDEASGETSTYGVGNANGDYTNNGGADNDHGGNGNTNNGNGKPGNNGNGSGNNGNGNNEGDGGAISDWAVKKLKKLGFTDMDIEMLERLGVTDADARQIIETAKVPNTGNGPTHFIPAYDLMYYVNDVNRENTEVLTLGSRYNSDTSFVYGQQRLYADHEGESETYLYDGRGSVVQLLKDGAVTQEYAYDAYGYINADEFGIQAPFYGYNGEEQNPFTGLQYLRARYYAPQNGGFITQDSFSGVLTNALSQNRYAYAHNNPVNYADPSGHSIWDSIKNGVTNAVNSVKNFVSNVANKVSSAVSTAVNAVKSAVTGTTTKTVANTSSAVKKSYTNTAVRQKIGSYAGGAAAAAAGSVSTSYSNSVVNGVVADSRIPFTNAAGQTISVPSHFSNLAEAAKDFVRRVCDAETKRIEAQQSVELEQQKILSEFMRDAGKLIGGTAALGGYLFAKGPFGQLVAFLQGTVTAVGDDLSAPLQSLGGSSSWAGSNGLYYFAQPSTIYAPLFGNQDALALGRGFGHILSVALGAAGELGTTITSAGLIAASGLLALPTGGTVLIPGVEAAEAVLVNGSAVSIAIMQAGVEGFNNDPNMQFSSNGEASSTGRGVGGKGWRGDKTWKQNVRTISEGGTIYDLNGQVPTQQEAIDLIEEAGGTVKRIEGPHNAPNPHNFNHINYTTPGGEKGTIRIQ